MHDMFLNHHLSKQGSDYTILAWKWPNQADMAIRPDCCLSHHSGRHPILHLGHLMRPQQQTSFFRLLAKSVMLTILTREVCLWPLLPGHHGTSFRSWKTQQVPQIKEVICHCLHICCCYGWDLVLSRHRRNWWGLEDRSWFWLKENHDGCW